MGASTRESVAAADQALDDVLSPGLIDRIRGAAEDLGGELLSASRVIIGSRQLTSLLADPGTDPKNRRALITRLFGRAYDRHTVRLIEDLAASRWSDPADLVDALERTGIRALALTNPDQPIDSELFTVQRAVSSDSRLELALGATSTPPAARLALVDRLLVNASPATAAIVRHIVQQPRGVRIIERMQSVERVVAAARGRSVATAQVARPLSTAQLSSLEERLSASYGRKIVVNQVIDSEVLGGVRVTVGSDVIDGSIRARLDDLRLRLAG